MTTVYGRQQASALRMIQRKGAAITFTLNVPGSGYDGATDTWAVPASQSVVSGFAVGIGNNPAAFAAQQLVLIDPATWLFAPSTPGQKPALNSVTTWGGTTYTVKSSLPLSPDGTPIVSTVVGSQ